MTRFQSIVFFVTGSEILLSTWFGKSFSSCPIYNWASRRVARARVKLSDRSQTVNQASEIPKVHFSNVKGQGIEIRGTNAAPKKESRKVRSEFCFFFRLGEKRPKNAGKKLVRTRTFSGISIALSSDLEIGKVDFQDLDFWWRQLTNLHFCQSLSLVTAKFVAFF